MAWTWAKAAAWAACAYDALHKLLTIYILLAAIKSINYLSDSLSLCLSLRLHLGRYLSLLLGHESLVPGWVPRWQEVVGW